MKAVTYGSFLIVVGAGVLALSGCVGIAGMAGAKVDAFSGPSRADSEVAVITRTKNPASFGRAFLKSVDDVDYGDDLLRGWPSTVRVLPGEHKIAVKCHMDSRHAFPAVRHRFVAGKTYELGCIDSGTGYAIATVTEVGAPPEHHKLLRAQGYTGPELDKSEVATLFLLDGRPNYESGYVCQVNSIPTRRAERCASVVYLRPGSHDLDLQYLSRAETGQGSLKVHVEAGRVYQVNVSSLRTRNAGLVTLIPMNPGTKLTFRNVAPMLSNGSPDQDEEIPYGAN